jgi:hypothetical protein
VKLGSSGDRGNGRDHIRSERHARAVIVSSAVYGHSGGNIPSVMLGSRRDATGNMIMIGTGRERWPTVRVADLADVFRRVPGRRPNRPTVSDQSMWRVYSPNVNQTLLAGLRVWAMPG